MELDQFAAMTRNVLREQGFAGFQPTACFPERRVVRALSGVPSTEAQEPIALRWATGLAEPGEEYLVAFANSATEFKIVRFIGGDQEQGVYAAVA